MTLHVHAQVFHNGVPVELLYLVRKSEGVQVWRAQPLFVIAEERDIHIQNRDRLTALHTTKRA